MALYCGIDLHSTRSWIAILDQKLNPVRQAKFDNDLATIVGFLEPYRTDLAGIAVESTFNWYWLVDGLMEAGHRVHLTNTWEAKQYDGLKYTDDRHDARWLARLLCLGILPEGYIYPKGERAVRDLLRRRSFLVHKKVSFLLSMRGAFECWTGTRTNANQMKTMTPEEIEALIVDPVAALGITTLVNPLRAINEEIAKLEKKVLKRGRLRDEFKLLQTVWGIGKVLGMTIMYEAGDFSRFPGVGNFASYCRCVKSDRLSNGKKKGSGNTKNGNPYLSWAFSEAAHFAVRHHEPARRYLQRKRSKTKAIVATRALAHKLARASYWVVRRQEPFDPARLFA
jgi:transposase